MSDERPTQNTCCGDGKVPVGDIEDLIVGPQSRATSSSKLFHHSSHVDTTKPLLAASTLRSECYYSEEWFNRELNQVFATSWTLIGREDEIPSAGEYLAIDTVWGGPVAVTRQHDGTLRAFQNVCAHRGAKVLQGTSGTCPKIGMVCPYHAWTYEYSGDLKWAPGMRNIKGFDESHIRLKPVRFETIHGFIFVCTADETEPLSKVLGDLPEKMAPWFGAEGKMRDMVCVGRETYEVDCNWKFLMENTSETYHTAIVHKDSLGPMDARPFPPHHGVWDGVEVPSSRSIVPLPEDFADEHPLPTFTNRTAFINLFPALQINVTWDCAWWMWLEPLSPTRTRITQGFCFPKTSTMLPQFPGVLEKYRRRWHIAVTEDNEISLNQQRGVRFRQAGRFSPLEFAVHNFNNFLLSRILDDFGQAKWNPGQRVHVGDGMSDCQILNCNVLVLVF
eukprot:m.55701 g.55701  ORF g.55701 m.55701 type:complete len:447 (+) comp22119_c0_seq4:113-1453(+)